MKSLLQKIKDTCEMEVDNQQGQAVERPKDGLGEKRSYWSRNKRGRIAFAELILKEMKRYKEKPVYYTITVPVSEEDAHRIVHDGDTFEWVFTTEEDENTRIRVNIVDEEEEHL